MHLAADVRQSTKNPESRLKPAGITAAAIFVLQSRLAIDVITRALRLLGQPQVPVLTGKSDIAIEDQLTQAIGKAASTGGRLFAIVQNKDLDAVPFGQIADAAQMRPVAIRVRPGNHLQRAAEIFTDVGVYAAIQDRARDAPGRAPMPDLTTIRSLLARAHQQEIAIDRYIPPKTHTFLELSTDELLAGPQAAAHRITQLLDLGPGPEVEDSDPDFLAALAERRERIVQFCDNAEAIAKSNRITTRKDRVPLAQDDPRRVAMIAMVKDEEDIIYQNLLWHFAIGIRQFVILDNLSTDGTRAEIDRFARLCEPMGARLLVLDDREVGYYQSRKMTAAANLAQNYFGAEWVFPLDADEFLMVEKTPLLDTLANAERVLQRTMSIPRNSPLFLAAINILTRNHVCSTIDDPDEPDIFRRMTRCERKNKSGAKTAILWNGDLVIGQGNHNASIARAQLPSVAGAQLGLHIRHFPVRSFEHFVRKSENGGKAYESAPDLATIGSHWRKWYAILLKEGKEGLRGIYEETFLKSPAETRFDPMPRLVVKNNDVVIEPVVDKSRHAPISIPILGQHAISLGGLEFEPDKLTVKAPVLGTPLTLRMNSSDITTFYQVFVQNEYDIVFDRDPEYILDLGANIGLAAIYFAGRYADAKIVSVEPNAANCAVLEANIAGLRHAHAVQAAVWPEAGKLRLVTEDDDGKAFGFWGTQTRPVEQQVSGGNDLVDAVTINQLVDRHGFPRIDLLKVDIEGAELELFSSNVEQWLHMVENVVVETHDRFKPGSKAAVQSALIGAGFSERKSGENLIYSRNTSGGRRPAASN